MASKSPAICPRLASLDLNRCRRRTARAYHRSRYVRHPPRRRSAGPRAATAFRSSNGSRPRGARDWRLASLHSPPAAPQIGVVSRNRICGVCDAVPSARVDASGGADKAHRARHRTAHQGPADSWGILQSPVGYVWARSRRPSHNRSLGKQGDPPERMRASKPWSWSCASIHKNVMRTGRAARNRHRNVMRAGKPHLFEIVGRLRGGLPSYVGVARAVACAAARCAYRCVLKGTQTAAWKFARISSMASAWKACLTLVQLGS